MLCLHTVELSVFPASARGKKCCSIQQWLLRVFPYLRDQTQTERPGLNNLAEKKSRHLYIRSIVILSVMRIITDNAFAREYTFPQRETE
jgi:hypothetical protein